MTATLVRASAMQMHCPRCGAKPGAKCKSVVGSKAGYVKRFVHNARKRAAS